MRRILLYLMCHLCSLLVALPIGWCCWLPTVGAQEDPVKPKCCCCGEQEASKPSKPVPTPKAPLCCCEPMPAALSDLAQELGIELSSFVFLPTDVFVAPHSFTRRIGETALPDCAETSPPIRVLQCTWLC